MVEIKIVKKDEEYAVQWIENGVVDEVKTYYTDDKDDAIATKAEIEKKIPITKEEIKTLIENRGLTLVDLIDVVIDMNGFVGVGLIRLADDVSNHITGKINPNYQKPQLVAYVIIETEKDDNGEYIPCIVKDGEKGYYKTDYRYGTDYNHAKECVDALNRKLGLSEREVMRLSCESMFGKKS
jgi:hypothetical protein